MDLNDKKIHAAKTILELQASGLTFEEVVDVLEIMLSASMVTVIKKSNSEMMKYQMVQDYCARLEKQILLNLRD